MYDIDYVMEQFELYCEPNCNFCAARYKFCQVPKRENEMMNAFYHHIQKICVQCQFSDNKECLVDAIIYGTKVQKAREKLLQMPKHLTLHDCLKIYHHYELLQYHLNVVKPMDKPVESITKCHFNRGGRQSSAGAKKSGTFRSQPNNKPVNSANNTVQCSNCSTTHLKNQCLAYQVTCFKCNRISHYASECRSSSNSPNSTQNTRQFTRFHGRGRTPHGRGFTPRRQVKLSASNVSKIDTNSGFWILPLDPSFQLVTTFDTLWSRFCFMKLPFGLCESQYFFQYYMDLNFESITNAHIIAKDVLIVGSDSGPLDEHDHDRCLLQVLNWCREVGLKLNAAKCIFKAKQVVFYGHLVHTNGLSPDPHKVQAISNMSVPSNKTELQSYIGMCNFLSSYVLHLTDRLYVL